MIVPDGNRISAIISILPTALGCLDFIRHRRLSVAGSGAHKLGSFLESIAAGDAHVAIIEGGIIEADVIGVSDVEAVTVAAAGGGGKIRGAGGGGGGSSIWGIFYRNELEIIHSCHLPAIEGCFNFDGISRIDCDFRGEGTQYEILPLGLPGSELLV